MIFDVDGTRQTARQRAIVTDPTFPPVQRRFDMVCKPGYGGRKRGEVVRTRSVLQQAHTHEWMGTWAAPGSGDGWGDLGMASACIGQYMDHHQLPRKAAVVRLDGLYGHIPPITEVQKAGLGYVSRCCDYAMLKDPVVQTAIAAGPVETMVQPDTGTRRLLFDIPSVKWHAAEHSPIPTRMIVGRTYREPGKKVRVGRRSPEWTDELFVTDLSSEGWSAGDVVDLYFGRGGFEATLAQDDAEQLADHWCSHNPAGQELWQILHQWIWNLRIWLGQPDNATIRQTEMAPAQVPPASRPAEPIGEKIDEITVMTVTSVPTVAIPSEPDQSAVTEVANASAPTEKEVTMECLRPALSDMAQVEPDEPSAPGVVAKATGRGSGKFGGTDFHWKSGSLICPAGQVLRRMTEWTEPQGIRMIYQAPAAACANCGKKEQCLAPGAQLRGRKVSVWKRSNADKASPEAPSVPVSESPIPGPIRVAQVEAASPPAPIPTSEPLKERVPPVPTTPLPTLGLAPILWNDVPASVWRRTIQGEIRLQRADVGGEIPEAPGRVRISRAERAHRRLTWHQRHQRNARRQPATWEIRLHGIPERLCKWLAGNAGPSGGA